MSNASVPPRTRLKGAQPSATQNSQVPLWRNPSRLPLLRPKRGRIFCGVCKGVSLHTGIPVWIVRIAFLVTSVFFGAGLVTYILLWILVPNGDPFLASNQTQQSPSPLNGTPLARGNTNFNIPQHHSRDEEFKRSSVQPDNFISAVLNAPKPALLASLGVIILLFGSIMLLNRWNISIVLPILLTFTGVGIAWLQYGTNEGRVWTTISAVSLIFAAYALYAVMGNWGNRYSVFSMLSAGLILLVAVAFAIVPWINSLIQDLGTERALKEREEERADMTAHLHDGVLQTLALIQVHSEEPQTVFTLARQQERELREWLYQERTTSDRSVSAGLKDIAAHIEDEHGKPIEVVTVGDAQPSVQTDALLDAANQALVNAVTHGAEPIAVYCEAGSEIVEIFVRDHGTGFDIQSIPESRLGIRESIIGRIRRRGGTVEIVSRPEWGTEVRMHMPITLHESTVATMNRDTNSSNHSQMNSSESNTFAHQRMFPMQSDSRVTNSTGTNPTATSPTVTSPIQANSLESAITEPPSAKTTHPASDGAIHSKDNIENTASAFHTKVESRT